MSFLLDPAPALGSGLGQPLYDRLMKKGRGEALAAVRRYGGGADSVDYINMALNGDLSLRTSAIERRLPDYQVLITWRADFYQFEKDLDEKLTAIIQEARAIAREMEQHPMKFYHTPGGKAAKIKKLLDQTFSLTVQQTERRNRVTSVKYAAEAQDGRFQDLKKRLKALDDHWSNRNQRRVAARRVLISQPEFETQLARLATLSRELEALIAAEDRIRLDNFPSDRCRLCN